MLWQQSWIVWQKPHGLRCQKYSLSSLLQKVGWCCSGAYSLGLGGLASSGLAAPDGALHLGDIASSWTLPATPSSAGAELAVRQSSRVFSGRRKSCKKSHPLSAWIPVASLLFILQTPQELIFHAISAENSYGRTTIWRSGRWGRACLCSRAKPAVPQVACPRCTGPRPGFLLG